MEKDFGTPIEEALNEGFIMASKQIQRAFRISLEATATAIQPCPKDGHRMQVCNELSLGILAPLTGKLTGHLVFLAPWSVGQRLWAEVLGSAPLTPNDLRGDHIKTVLEAAKALTLGFASVVKKNHEMSCEATDPSIAVEMAPRILQTMTIEAVRRKMSILPFRIVLKIADIEVEGQVFVVSTARTLKAFLNRTGVAA